MADPLNRCPAAVRDRSPFLSVDLEALVPYNNVREVVVSVPAFNVPSPFLGSITDPSKALTRSDGTRPEGGGLAGWHSDAEQGQERKLRDLASEIIDKRDELHPQAREDVLQLAAGAWTDLDRIKAIYKKWAESYMGVWSHRQDYVGRFLREDDHAADYGQTKPSGNKQSLSLTLRTPFDFIEGNVVGPEYIDEEEGTSTAPLFFNRYRDLLLMPGETYGAGVTINTQGFFPLMLDARKRDRDRIRNLWLRVYRQLWCAEYGVAQSESYNGNKALFEEAAGAGGGMTLGGADKGTQPVVMTFVPVVDGGGDGGFDWGETGGSTGAPPPETGEEPGPADDAIVEDEETGLVEVEGVEDLPDTKPKWYQTTGGKVAIGLGVVVGGGAAVVGIARALRGRGAPR